MNQFTHLNVCLFQQRLQQKLYLLPSDRLSPPSTISRLSDSDISDVEYFEHESEYGLNTSRGELTHEFISNTRALSGCLSL